MPDAFIEFRGAGLMFRDHVRPNLVRYTEAQHEDLVKTWDTMPAATQHWAAWKFARWPQGRSFGWKGDYCGASRTRAGSWR